MFTSDMHDFKIRQAELVREAQQFRLIRSLQVQASPSRGLTSLIRGLINLTLFP